MRFRTEDICCWVLNRYPWCTGPVKTLFDGLFLRKLKINELKTFAEHDLQLRKCCLKFCMKSLNRFRAHSLSPNNGFLLFFFVWIKLIIRSIKLKNQVFNLSADKLESVPILTIYADDIQLILGWNFWKEKFYNFF